MQRSWLFAVVLAAGCGAGSERASNGAVYMGACTGKADSTGGYSCQETWQIPEEGLDLQALNRHVCETSEGTYSSGHCAGGAQPGCCTLPPASNGTIVKMCHYQVSDPEGALQKQCLDGFSGVWN